MHPAGYGFVVREDGEEDVHIGQRYRGLAIDGDRVRLRVWTGDRGTEGRVEEVLEHGRTKLTGTLRIDGKKAFVEPDDPRIVATSGHVVLDGGARAQTKAAPVRMVNWPWSSKSRTIRRWRTSRSTAASSMSWARPASRPPRSPRF